MGQAERTVVKKACANLGDWPEPPSLRHFRAKQGAKRRAQTLESIPLRRSATQRSELCPNAATVTAWQLCSCEGRFVSNDGIEGDEELS
ncbi:hypothetical protein, partial [Mesorhizobium sp.]|uniref:hypothetical protein n=1 Tax=Mesorhizobium sp. TaxID=1871066 RepID=UPI0025BD2133